MKFFITINNLNFESLKKLSLGKKIVIGTIVAIVAQAFGIIFLLFFILWSTYAIKLKAFTTD